MTVAAGCAHTMAVGVDGALWAWGMGFFGQLGLGDTNDRLVPTLVGTEEVFGTRSTLPTHPSPPLPLAPTTRQP